ncbi:Trk system potassium transporter TrkA [Orenia marismortui]|uniref:Trk system potassium uptake protein TrkA n=1 Tax=Orenia marismortui TaxID=46469 RepID=A0A4R8HAS1_9FIRM|nr:Trk system potassium transporter TrkA [Orenia marismortui]TDX52683.1 trk system potassium uptake protein TrkA [Orenia marismortui]
MKEVVSKIKKVTTGFTTSTKQTIIVGGNEASIQLAERLIKSNQDIVIIEENDISRKNIEEKIDVLTIKGKGTDINTLRKAGATNTNLLIAITNNDYENLLTGIYAKQLGVDNVVIQVKEEINLNYNLQQQEFNINLIVNPFSKVVKKVKGIIKPGVELELDNYLDKRVQISKFKVSHQSSFAYNSIDKVNLPKDSLILAILRKGRVIIPKGRDKIYPGDNLFIICHKGFKGKISQLINSHHEDNGKIVLVGAGEINYQLAKQFSKISTVTIIEEDREKCEEIADNLSNILVLEGRGTDIELLKEEGVAKADAFIATTTSDESNLLMAKLAKSLGVKNSIAIVTDISYTYLVDFLDIDYIISPSAITVDSILDYFYQGQVKGETIFEGQVNIVEVKINKSAIIKDLSLASDIIIALIKRDNNVIIPNGASKLRRGDKILVLSLTVKGDIRGYFNQEARK